MSESGLQLQLAGRVIFINKSGSIFPGDNQI